MVKLEHFDRFAYSDCIAALDGNCAARAHAEPPFSALLASSAQLHSDVSDSAEWHRSFEGLTQSETVKGRTRSRSDVAEGDLLPYAGLANVTQIALASTLVVTLTVIGVWTRSSNKGHRVAPRWHTE